MECTMRSLPSKLFSISSGTIAPSCVSSCVSVAVSRRAELARFLEAHTMQNAPEML